MVDLSEFISELRALGVSKIQLEITPLVDTIPAPAFEAMDPIEVEKLLAVPEPEPKAPGICIADGCNDKGGHRFAPEFCRKHALDAAGVGE